MKLKYTLFALLGLVGTACSNQELEEGSVDAGQVQVTAGIAIGAIVHLVGVECIVDCLCGEKIDIVRYNEEPEQYISASLAPADVISVEVLDDAPNSCRVVVPDNQLSLAIGNKGQNARLAAKLTGWKIDIRPESGFYGE